MAYQWKGWMEETHRIFIYLSDDEDSLIWIGNKVDGFFSVNLAYKIFWKGKEENRRWWWNVLWKVLSSNKRNLFMWLILKDRVLTS